MPHPVILSTQHYYTAPCCTTLQDTHCITQNTAPQILYCTAPHYTILHQPVLHLMVLQYTIVHCTTLHCATPVHILVTNVRSNLKSSAVLSKRLHENFRGLHKHSPAFHITTSSCYMKASEGYIHTHHCFTKTLRLVMQWWLFTKTWNYGGFFFLKYCFIMFTQNIPRFLLCWCCFLLSFIRFCFVAGLCVDHVEHHQNIHPVNCDKNPPHHPPPSPCVIRKNITSFFFFNIEQLASPLFLFFNLQIFFF